MDRVSPENRPIVFCHIPKTAGVSVRSVIGLNFAADEILQVTNPMEVVREGRADDVAGYGFVHGHFGVDIADLFPTAPAMITFVRDPVRRILSYYRFLRSFDPSDFQGTEVEVRRVRLASELSLAEFAVSDDRAIRSAVSNRQVSFLSGTERRIPGRVRLDVARDHVDRLTFVGITESMDRSLQLLCHTFSWCPPLASPVLNRSNTREVDPDPDAIEKIRDRNDLDCELYDHALSRFEQDYSEMVQTLLDRNFENELEVEPGAVDGLRFRMQDRLNGRGWYEREDDGKGTTWRASGPLRESTIYLPRSRSSSEDLFFTVHCAVNEEVLQTLRVRIDAAIQLPKLVETSAIGRRYRVELPEAAEPGRSFWRVDFLVDRTLRPVDLYDDNPDYRQLGIALTALDLVRR